MADYLNPMVVLAMDMCLSLLSSLLVFLLASYVSQHTSLFYHTSDFTLVWMLSSFVGTSLGIVCFKSYRLIIRHSSIKDVGGVGLSCFVKVLVMAVAVSVFYKLKMGVAFELPFDFDTLKVGIGFCLLYDFLISLFLIICARVVMLFVYDVFKRRANAAADCKRVLVYGISDKSVSLMTRLQNSPHYRIVGFLAKGLQARDIKLSDLPICSYGTEDELKEIFDTLSASCLLFPEEEGLREEREGLVDFCTKSGIKALVVPTVEEIAPGNRINGKIREVKIEDLLGRNEIKISMEEITANFKGKVVMVTGAAGSIGSELCRQLAGFGVRRLVLFDNAETPMHNIRLELEEKYPGADFVPVIGDVRQVQRLDFVFREYRPQILFHAAA